MKLARCVILLALLATAGSVGAGSIDEALVDRMSRIESDTPISAIVHMAEQAPVARLNQELRDQGATRRERHQVVVEALQAATVHQQPFREYLEERMIRGGVQGYTGYWISNLLVVMATPEEIYQIAARPDVEWVESNFSVSLIEPSNPDVTPMETDEGTRGIGVTPGLRALRADEVWYTLGITGAGRLLGNLDTGVDGNHPALNTRWRGYNGQNPWQECWLDVLGTNTQFPVDNYGHGTHVIGTMTGLGAATEDTIGVAWGAQWIACNAIDQGVGGGFDNDVIAAYQWFADPDGNPGTVDDVADVVQNSWRINENFGGNYTDCDTRWWAVIDNCEASGTVTTWSAGNEGPGATTIGSPPDRATTLTNAFSVGAVDATNFNWPYPIANFSSRGPTGCNVDAEHKIKPEVAAPGVTVYSSVPGGGYQQSGWSGTSMAGPHAAGIVALMRQANPNLDVDTIKQILMETARDEGSAGEDNTFGWGFVDAFEAVSAAMDGFGSLEGHVRNGSWNNVPIAGATVELLDTGYSFDTDGVGFYGGAASAASYTARASRNGFEPAEMQVVIQSNQVTVQDFALTDNAGPEITDVTDDGTTTDTVGPYAVRATVRDFSTVPEVLLYYRINNGPWTSVAMTFSLNGYSTSLAGRPAGTQIDYYVAAEDGLGHGSTEPEDAPASFYTLYVTEIAYLTEAEDPGDPEWMLGAPGDQATTGIWIRADPVGTNDGGEPIQPEDDHTPNPGVKCFVTGNGSVGGGLGENDVDNGCTTLLSPVFDLSDATIAFVTYHRWYAMASSNDDTFVIDASSDGGTTWYPLERVSSQANSWLKVTLRIDDVVGLTDQVRFRFQACDINTQGITEAAVDDFSIEKFAPGSSSSPEPVSSLPAVSLSQNEPNPAGPSTTIRLRLSNASEARLDIYDATGRKVRTLHEGPLTAGTHELRWNGLDDQGNGVAAGVYFYRLKAGAYEQSRRMTFIR
jgi:hypothetical protein